MQNRFVAGWLVAMAGILAAPLAWAEDLALIVANEFYQNHPRVPDTRGIVDLEAEFHRAGFATVRLSNLRSDEPEADSDALLRRMNRADRMVVVLSGHFVRSAGGTWLLNVDAERPTAFTIGRSGTSVASIMDIASRKQGDAVIALATGGNPGALGFGVAPGFTRHDIPQGVTLLSGTPRQITAFIEDDLLQPGRVISQAVKTGRSGVSGFGFLPTSQPFITTALPAFDPLAIERSVWAEAETLNTVASYRTYLNDYPNGQFAGQARQRIRSLTETPEQRAQRIEDSLNLTRVQRRNIQRDLTILGFDTGGDDGILGRRSRQAAAAWQGSINVPRTGYFSANQISLLNNQAQIRRAELAAQAEAQRLEHERRDRQYWNQTGAGGSETGLRNYLQRYPDGLFADQARARLQEWERQQRREAQKAERDAWDRAVMAGTQQSYQQYLNQYPQGRFAEEARARVASLTQPETPPEVVEAARREEASLNLTVFTRALIEGQLVKLGRQPGQVDGRFDQDTRRALRRYQRDNGLPVTGFVTRDVVTRLLASAVQ